MPTYELNLDSEIIARFQSPQFVMSINLVFAIHHQTLGETDVCDDVTVACYLRWCPMYSHTRMELCNAIYSFGSVR
jgi:hypothetical protein